MNNERDTYRPGEERKLECKAKDEDGSLLLTYTAAKREDTDGTTLANALRYYLRRRTEAGMGEEANVGEGGGEGLQGRAAAAAVPAVLLGEEGEAAAAAAVVGEQQPSPSLREEQPRVAAASSWLPPCPAVRTTTISAVHLV